MAVTNPCTASRTLPRADFVLSAAYLAGAFYPLLTDAASRTNSLGWRLRGDDTARNILGITGLGLSVAQVFSGLKGNNKVRDCRAFNVRLSEERRQGTQAQATYNWLDEFSPVPDFGVASHNLPAIIPPVWGFRSVFSGPIRNSSEDLEGRGKKRAKPQQPQEPPTQPAR